MIQMINKLKKNQKGFTLVELIVVLVILAILAAFTIPAMLGFINDARAKAFVSQTREVYMAYQAAISDVTSGSGYAGGTFTASEGDASPDPAVTSDANKSDVKWKIQQSAMNKLIGDVVRDDGYRTKAGIKYKVTVTDKQITEVKFFSGDYTITLVPDGVTGSGVTTEKGDHV